MAHPSGSKVIGPCRYCGKRYKLTNWMMRSKNLQKDVNGRWLTDAHLIACYAKNPPTKD